MFRKSVLYFGLASVLISGCKNFKNEFDQVSRERDSLIYITDLKDSSINSLLYDFNNIEKNLDSITSRQEAIDITSMTTEEIKNNQRDRINENIRIINDLLDHNRKLITDLQSRLRASQGRVTELNTLVERLQEQIAEKDKELGKLKAEIAELNLNLDNLNVVLDTITVQKQETERELNEKIAKLNTAYYITGSFKELRGKNVVNKEGGFLGIGKNQMLKQDFNNDAFTKVDITQFNELLFNSKEGKIITNHPSGSYSLIRKEGKVTGIKIEDYEKFWGASKYLVVITN
ncbi:MAG: hypothetical protein LC117_03200 [Bacteroidia bacterium]|nr:hypothetical protein [Bacteroidia bacterium]MCZ2276918.1 hypothetical protein [Bacteroidia bacterium]